MYFERIVRWRQGERDLRSLGRSAALYGSVLTPGDGRGRALAGHTGWVTAVAVLPNGRRALSGLVLFDQSGKIEKGERVYLGDVKQAKRRILASRYAL